MPHSPRPPLPTSQAAIALQAISAKRTLANQPAACMHFTRELVDLFTSINLMVLKLIDLFLNQLELETTISGCPLGWPQHPYRASPAVSLQIPLHPISPHALPSSTFYLPLCWRIFIAL